MSKNIINLSKLNKKNFVIYNDKSYLFSEIKKKILIFKKKYINYQKGICSITSNNKIDYLTNYFSLLNLNFPIFLNNNNSLSKISREKINICYLIKNNKLVKINKTSNQKFNYSTIIKTSGSTKEPRYVILKNDSLIFVCRNLNISMNLNKNKIFELIFAPIDHAFGFARMISLINSNNNFILTDEYSFSKLFELKKKYNFTGLSIPAKILSMICEFDMRLIKNLLYGLKYIHVSTGHFPIKFRKKILNLGVNLYINYGSTEAMRSTFLDCKKFQNKIHTEGKPFRGVKIKILKKNKKKNELGKILIKGKNLAYRYENINDWESSQIDGYFTTGDFGLLDNEGFLIFKGREDDRININGKIINVNLIEEKIKEKFNIKNLKIISKKIGNNLRNILFIEKKYKIKKEILYKYLKNENINITFYKVIYVNFNKNNTGKINIKNLIKFFN